MTPTARIPVRPKRSIVSTRHVMAISPSTSAVDLRAKHFSHRGSLDLKCCHLTRQNLNQISANDPKLRTSPHEGPNVRFCSWPRENCDDLGRKIGGAIKSICRRSFCESFGVDSFLEAPPFEVLVIASLVATSSKMSPRSRWKACMETRAAPNPLGGTGTSTTCGHARSFCAAATSSFRLVKAPTSPL